MHYFTVYRTILSELSWPDKNGIFIGQFFPSEIVHSNVALSSIFFYCTGDLRERENNQTEHIGSTTQIANMRDSVNELVY